MSESKKLAISSILRIFAKISKMSALTQKRYRQSEIQELYHTPLLKLVLKAAKVHEAHHNAHEVKASRLISVKTGSCVEDCAYCAQSSRYNTDITPSKILSKEEVRLLAQKAKDEGLSRVCLSASFKEMPDGKSFDNILSMIENVKEMGLDVCLTMGKLSPAQAAKLSKSGIKAYNHNIDTSNKYYPKVITTRKFEERLETLNILADHGINICSGGIIGLGENANDRISMLHTLSNLKTQPYTVPLNILVPVKGTPMAEKPVIDELEMVRLVALTRILMPKTNISLAAGRKEMSKAAQALCFLSGVNAVFVGEKLLTADNAAPDIDKHMFENLGINII